MPSRARLSRSRTARADPVAVKPVPSLHDTINSGLGNPAIVSSAIKDPTVRNGPAGSCQPGCADRRRSRCKAGQRNALTAGTAGAATASGPLAASASGPVAAPVSGSLATTVPTSQPSAVQPAQLPGATLDPPLDANPAPGAVTILAGVPVTGNPVAAGTTPGG